MFNVIGTAGTGLQTYHTWLDVIADNIANVNTTSAPGQPAFRTHYVTAQEITGGNGNGNGDGSGGGVRASEITEGQAGQLVYSPNDPNADKQGYVQKSNVDLSAQMTDMIMAQRAFQANANVVDRAKDTYEAAINIGKGI